MGLELSKLEGLENQPLKKRIDAFKDEQIAEALLKSNGLQYIAAERMGLCPTTIGKRIKQSPFLQEIMSVCREHTLDQYEAALREKVISDRDTGAICFALKTIGKSRGYGQDNIIIDTTDPIKALMNQIRSSKNLIEHDDRS